MELNILREDLTAIVGPGVLGKQVHVKAWRCAFIFFSPLMSLKLGNMGVTIRSQTHIELSAHFLSDVIYTGGAKNVYTSGHFGHRRSSSSSP